MVGKGQTMATTKQEVEQSLLEHDVIKEHMQFLVKRLSGLASQKPTDIKEEVTLYRWSLYDFREAIRRHVALDERIVHALPADETSRGLSRDHSLIVGLVDGAIALAEQAVYTRLGPQEMEDAASKLTDAVTGICRDIADHMAREDQWLTKSLKGT